MVLLSHLATSDGTKDSLNSTSGGHCDDEANGVSMKMIIYVCINETGLYRLANEINVVQDALITNT